MTSLKYILICVCMVFTLSFSVSADEFVTLDVAELYSDEQQTGDIVISNYEELCSFRDAVNKGENVGVNAVLAADITLSGEWTPIGNSTYPFNGNFDGQGHKITGMSITSDHVYCGFFGKVANGRISGIEFVDAVINVNVSSGTENYYVGVAVGAVFCDGSKNNVVVEQIKVNGGSVSAFCKSYSTYCAAVVGHCESDNYGTVYVKDCSVENVTITAKSDSKSAFSGLVTGAFYSRSATDSSISNCVVNGSCYAESSLSALSGLVVGTAFANGYWASAPSSLASDDKIIIVDNCIASGSVSTVGTVNSYASSISGSLSAAAVVGNVYYTDDVELSAIKGGAAADVKRQGTNVALSNFNDASYVKDTVKLDTVDTWKVNSNALPSLYAFDDGYFAVEVSEGTRLYYADDMYRDFDKETITYIDLSKNGTYYTLKENDKQRVWNVYEAAAVEVKDLENALSTSSYAQIRTKEPSGMRFSSSITDSAKCMSGMLDVVEYGYLVTAENSVTGLVEGEYDLDFTLVDSGKAKKGVAYSTNDGIDLVFERDAVNEKTVFTGVMYNIPLTKAGVTTVIATRPYYKTGDGEIVMGAVYKATLYDTAVAIKNDNGDAYTQNKEYIDSIIALVQQ